jgi:hypothetical protein
MPSIDFPNNPTVNQEFTSGNRTWIWTGTAWDSKGTIQAPGPANELSVGTVTTVVDGNDAEVTITGESPEQTINFVIPAGPQGPPGNLTNLQATSPILYNSGTSTLSFAGITLDDVTNVSAASPSTGDTIYWNGTAWVNSPLSLDGLTDVQLSGSPIVGDIMMYDGTKWVNTQPDAPLPTTFMMMGA